MANVVVMLDASDRLMKLGEDFLAVLRGLAIPQAYHRAAYTNEIVTGPKPENREPYQSETRRPEIAPGTAADKIPEAKWAASKDAPIPAAPSTGTTSAPASDAPADAPVKTYKLEEVRAKLGELSKAGKNIKGLIQSFGVRKLTDIPAEQYAAVMEKAGEL